MLHVSYARTQFASPGKRDRCDADRKNRITTLMHDLLVEPENFSKHIDRTTASSASIALFGQRAGTHDDFWATVSSLLKIPIDDVLSDIVRVRGYGGGMNKESLLKEAK